MDILQNQIAKILGFFKLVNAATNTIIQFLLT